MAGQLSQRDIDALLGKMDGPEAAPFAASNARPTKRYDFRKPDKFSKDHLRALQSIFESYARSLSTDLSAMLRSQVIVRLSSVEQTTYEEYVAQLPTPTSVAICSLPPLPDRIILEMSLQLVYVMFDRLLGGIGRPAPRSREVTEIETSMLQLIVQRVLPPLAEAWQGVCDVSPTLDELVFSPAYIPAAVPGTAAALIVFEATVGGSTGTISIAIPYTVLEPVMGKLSTQKWLSSPGMGTGSMENVALPHRPLRGAEVPIMVQLGTTQLLLSELLYLQAGDVIRLDTAPGDELSISVGDHKKFSALPGRVGTRMAVQISSILEDPA